MLGDTFDRKLVVESKFCAGAPYPVTPCVDHADIRSADLKIAIHRITRNLSSIRAPQSKIDLPDHPGRYRGHEWGINMIVST